MNIADLRVALFSGDYNYVRAGANPALNRLADVLPRQGAALRVYAPKVETPAFPPTGALSPIPAMPIPRRREYRIPLGLWGAAKHALAEFRPNVIHVSSPDPAAHAALKWAEHRDLHVLASVHTRFDSYMRYYGLGFR